MGTHTPVEDTEEFNLNLNVSSPTSLLKAAPNHYSHFTQFWASGKNGGLGLTLIYQLENDK